MRPMAKRTGSTKVPRRPLNREMVLRAAIELADQGIESLTMRELARQLGVEAMSLYHYVANKNELLDGIVDLVMLEIELPSDERYWKTAIRRCAVSAHRVFVRHPWACNLVLDSGSDSVPPSRFAVMEWMLRTLRSGGFSPDLACHAYHALDSHIMGFSLWVGNFPATKAELAEIATEFMPKLSRDDFPYVLEHIGEHLKPSPRGKKSDFEFALDLLLDGLERERKKAK